MNRDIKHRILIVEDELAIREMLCLSLMREGFDIQAYESAEEAIEVLRKKTVDLALLDWMLPGMNGMQLAKHIRETPSIEGLPIIMLTAKDEEEDKLGGFQAGIDDYVSKPFSVKEVTARIHALLRRTKDTSNYESNLNLSGIVINSDSHTVQTEKQEDIHLGPTEFKLLHFLMQNPNRVYSREQLLDNIWGVGVYVDERTVDVHIRRLRKALSNFNLDKVIFTVRGSGYRFIKQK